jgi:RNA polymerase sigma factor for flagellar operon FliA
MFNDPSTASPTVLESTESPGAPQGQSRDRLTDALARKYLVRVIAHAKRLARRLPAHVSLGDLISAGMLGVVEGFLRYDPSRAETLDAFLDHRIRGALLDELRRNDPLTRAQRGLARQIRQAPREASEESLAVAVGLSVSALREKVSQIATATAIQATGDGHGADDAPDHGLAPDAALEARQRHAQLVRAAADLPERERVLLTLHYEEGQSLREIGARLGVSESRASQLHSRAIQRMRASLAA